MSSSEGQKVTTDSESYNNPKTENPGVVTSDSLAAESIVEGGSFGATSDSRGPMEQPSYSTNTNTTDTSGATTLTPAPDAEARQVSEEWNETAVLNSGIGHGKDAGRGPTWNTPDVATNSAGTGTVFGAEARGIDADRDVAGKPKGEGLTEGGFDSSGYNASYSTEIGTDKDPGRKALETIQKENTPYAGGAGPTEEQISGDGQYDVLKETSA